MQLRPFVRFMLFGLSAIAAQAVADSPAIWVHEPAAALTDRAHRDTGDSRTASLTERSESARYHQRHPLETVVTIEFRTERSVGQAAGRLLAFVGYDFRVSGPGIDPQARVLFTRPLPDIHRSFEGVTVTSALLALLGDGYLLVVDPVERIASADVAPVERRRIAAQRLLEDERG